jgi:hypothetical protein
MRLFKSRTSDVMLFSDEIVDVNIVDYTGERIYEDEEGETYYEVNTELQRVYKEWCKYNKLDWCDRNNFARYESLRGL